MVSRNYRVSSNIEDHSGPEKTKKYTTKTVLGWANANRATSEDFSAETRTDLMNEYNAAHPDRRRLPKLAKNPPKTSKGVDKLTKGPQKKVDVIQVTPGKWKITHNKYD